VAHSKLSNALTQLMGRTLRTCCKSSAAAAAVGVQYEGNWSVAHAKLSDALTQLMGRMLRHLLQVAPEFPLLPRKSLQPGLLTSAIQNLHDSHWQAVSDRHFV
jgi:hypothetical protein